MARDVDGTLQVGFDRDVAVHEILPVQVREPFGDLRLQLGDVARRLIWWIPARRERGLPLVVRQPGHQTRGPHHISRRHRVDDRLVDALVVELDTVPGHALDETLLLEVFEVVAELFDRRLVDVHHVAAFVVVHRDVLLQLGRQALSVVIALAYSFGVSYVLANRQIMTRTLPDWFSELGVRSVDSYAGQLLDNLVGLSPRRAIPGAAGGPGPCSGAELDPGPQVIDQAAERRRDTTIRPAPTQMPASARLNAGQCQPARWKSRKSTTAP